MSINYLSLYLSMFISGEASGEERNGVKMGMLRERDAGVCGERCRGGRMSGRGGEEECVKGH